MPSKYIWFFASPLVLEFELADAASCIMHNAADQYSQQYSIQNVVLLADHVQMDPGLLNSNTKHIKNGGSLTNHCQTYSSIAHTILAGQDFSVNQTRAFTKLDTVFMHFARQEADGTVAPGENKVPNRIADTWWFEGLNSDTAPDATTVA